MESYIRNKFKFYGLKTPERRRSYHDFIKREKKNKKIDWDLLNQAGKDEHREAQYFVCDYLLHLKNILLLKILTIFFIM